MSFNVSVKSKLFVTKFLPTTLKSFNALCSARRTLFVYLLLPVRLLSVISLFRSDYLHLGFPTLFRTGVAMQMAHASRGSGGVCYRTCAIAMEQPNWISDCVGKEYCSYITIQQLTPGPSCSKHNKC